MSATAPLFERLATLEHQIEALQRRIVQGQTELKDTVDLEQTVAVLVETHRTYSARLAQLAKDEAHERVLGPRDKAMIDPPKGSAR